MKILSLLFCLLLLSVSVSAQVAWNTSRTVATSGSGNNHPRVTLDRAGNPLILWGHSSRVMFSRWDGMAFTAPKMINQPAVSIASASWMGPDIATHGDTVYVVMKQSPEDADTAWLWCAHSYDGGNTFSTPVKIVLGPGVLSRFPTVTTDSLGNPLVAFMRFTNTFNTTKGGNPQWAVVRSPDGGKTFSSHVQASQWSSDTAMVCDCCPGTIVSDRSIVAVVYRDNNSNIRDSWVGISTDRGATFARGLNVDNNHWNLNACPASGPAAVIIGDSLYSVFMNGASGHTMVYRSVSPLSGMSKARTYPLTGDLSGVDLENYPRIAHSGNAAAIVWTQTISGQNQLPLLFTDDITKGFSSDTVHVYDNGMNSVVNADVAMRDGKIYVIWENDNSGTITYRSGTYPTQPSAVQEHTAIALAAAYPNPVSDGLVQLHVGDAADGVARIIVTNILGQQMFVDEQPITQGAVNISLQSLPAGMYAVKILSGSMMFVTRVVRR